MITLTLREIDGKVSIESNAPYRGMDGDLGITVIGMLELAKASLIAGRWGVFDSTTGLEAKFIPNSGDLSE